MVPHALLIFKLQKLNIDPNVICWIGDYLNSRKQPSVINGIQSPYVNVNCGVPQGSLLGALLFLIFINDIVEFL